MQTRPVMLLNSCLFVYLIASQFLPSLYGTAKLMQCMRIRHVRETESHSRKGTLPNYFKKINVILTLRGGGS